LQPVGQILGKRVVGRQPGREGGDEQQSSRMTSPTIASVFSRKDSHPL
jgi:hypothetical protein